MKKVRSLRNVFIPVLPNVNITGTLIFDRPPPWGKVKVTHCPSAPYREILIPVYYFLFCSVPSWLGSEYSLRKTFLSCPFKSLQTRIQPERRQEKSETRGSRVLHISYSLRKNGKAIRVKGSENKDIKKIHHVCLNKWKKSSKKIFDMSIKSISLQFLQRSSGYWHRETQILYGRFDIRINEGWVDVSRTQKNKSTDKNSL